MRRQRLRLDHGIAFSVSARRTEWSTFTAALAASLIISALMSPVLGPVLLAGQGCHANKTGPESSLPGTPIEKNDANARAVFDDYISVYDIQRAVFDGATAPIYYESRLANHMQSRRGWCGWAQPSLRDTAEAPIAVAQGQGWRQLVEAQACGHQADTASPGPRGPSRPAARPGASAPPGTLLNETAERIVRPCPELMRRGAASARPVRWAEN